jgi:hypothetical protein
MPVSLLTVPPFSGEQIRAAEWPLHPATFWSNMAVERHGARIVSRPSGLLSPPGAKY